MFLPVTVLFFTRSAGLPAVTVGAGLSASGVAGLAVAPLGGHLLDRMDARWVLLVALGVRAACYGAYATVHSVTVFLPLVCIAGAASQAGRPARNVLATQVAPATERVHLLAVVATARNVGFGLGGLLASAALASDSRPGYLAVLWVNAASYVIAGTLLPGMPARRSPPAPRREMPRQRRAVLHDHAYVLLAALNAVVLVSDSVLVVGVPLWLAQATEAPRALTGVLFTLNTVMVVTLQIPAGRSGATVPGAARAYRRGGLAFAGACALFAFAARLGPVPASVALVLGVMALTGCEVWGSTGEWGISLGLAPESARGQYLSLYSMGFGVQKMLGPVLVTVVVISGGQLGWLVLGTAVLGAGASASFAARRVARRRTPMS